MVASAKFERVRIVGFFVTSLVTLLTMVSPLSAIAQPLSPVTELRELLAPGMPGGPIEPLGIGRGEIGNGPEAGSSVARSLVESTGPDLPTEEGRYIVVFKDSVRHPGALAAKQAAEVDGDVTLVYRSALKGYAAALPEGSVEILENEPTVDYVAPDRKVKIDAIPTGVERIEAPSNDTLKIDEKDNRRVDVDVAVLDTGVDYQHPDLNVVGRTNCVPSLASEKAECVDELGVDDNGHGTHVAGIVGARDNGNGVVGVAPGARLWAVKILNSGGFGYESWLVAGVDWVTAHSAQIEAANMSVGCGPLVDEEHLIYEACTMPALDDAIAESVNKGVVYVVAAGNRGVDTKYVSPANNPDVITVSALADYDGKSGGNSSTTCTNYGPDDTLATFSNHGSAVDVAAPGVCIRSTLPVNGGPVYPEKKYGPLSGTSMASPHVAGAAALLASEDNPEDLNDVEAIRQTIEEDGDQSWEDGEREPILAVGDEVDFSAASASPVVTRPPVGSVLQGEINPTGLATTYHFEYGATTSYGNSTSTESAGSGESYVSVAKEVKGLSAAGAIYHYRLVATNSSGTFHGTDRTLGITPPDAETGTASEITGWGARLHANINPGGLATSYYFDFGRTTSYKFSTASIPKSLAAGTNTVASSSWIGSLEPGVKYHYRVVAENAAGKDTGLDQTVTIPTSEWVVQETPKSDLGLENAKPGGEVLRVVSCGSSNDCMAAGERALQYALEARMVVEHWDGSKWVFSDVPQVEEEEPDYEGEVEHEWIQDMDCTSASWCVLVGTSLLKEENGYRTYIDRWDGSKWTMDVPVAELVGTHPDATLNAVSCLSASLCFVTGQYTDNDVVHAISLRWDGEEWSDEPVPLPGAADWAWLTSVSCASATSCRMSGGYAQLEPFLMQDFSLSWDGAEWSLDGTEPLTRWFRAGRFPSCFDLGVAGTGCWSTSGKTPGLDYFDGEAWGAETVEVDGLDKTESGAVLTEVSCDSGPCAAAGGYSAAGRSEELPLVAIWDGAKWSRQGVGVADPLQEFAGAGGGQGGLGGVDCTGRVCVAAGARRNSVDEIRPQILRYESERLVVKGEKATNTNSTSVTLNALINPNGYATQYQFEYGTTTSYGSKAPASPKDIGSEVKGVEVSEITTNLLPDTTYHFRVVASNAKGTTYGSDHTFTRDGSAPTAVTSAATNVDGAKATLHGKVNPNGLETTYQFEYGTTTAYGSKAPVELGIAGSGYTDLERAVTIKNLKPEATYHFRLVAKNKKGESKGQDMTFTTGEGPISPWSRLTPSPGVDAAEDGLQGVSCSMSNECMAVGFYRPKVGEGTTPLSQSWDGWSWTPQATAMPEGTEGGDLSAVSCPVTKACVAVGSYTDKSSGHVLPLIESWSGSEWSLQSAPLPEKATHAGLNSVSCISTTKCVAVGTYSKNGGGESLPYVIEWNGSKWSLQSVPLPSGSGSATLYGVSCTASNACTAVGAFGGGSLVETWNGASWSSFQPEADPLEGVSCTSAESCMAVGGSAVWIRTGSEWSQVEGPTAVEFEGTEEETEDEIQIHEAVACISAENCTVSAGSATGNAYLFSWDGSDWHLNVGETEAALSDLYCVAGEECVAVGMDSSYHSVIEQSLKGPTWADLLADEDSFVLQGDFTLDGEMGKISCSLSGSLTLDSGGPGRIEELSAAPGSCETSGFIESYCSPSLVDVDVRAERPIEFLTSENEGSQYVAAADVSLVYDFIFKSTGKTCITLALDGYLEFKAEGSGETLRLTALEDEAGLEAFGLGNMSPSGALAVKPPAENAPSLVRTDAPSGVSETEGTLNATINPQGNATSYYFEYGKTTAYGAKVPISPKSVGSGASNVAVSQTLTGLTQAREYHYRVVAEGAYGTIKGKDKTLKPPKATTGSSVSVQGTQATVLGTVNPESYATRYYFEYGTTTSYGAKSHLAGQAAGAGTETLNVNRTLTGLSQVTVYHYRLVASSTAGTTYGEDKSLTTIKEPKVTTEAATSVGSSQATLNATVNPEGSATTYYFQYGKTTSYGTNIPAPGSKSVGSGTSNVAVSQTPTGLASNTTYHYRVVASSAGGLVVGADKTLTTK
jgi:subtilisin family serine protease